MTAFIPPFRPHTDNSQTRDHTQRNNQLEEASTHKSAISNPGTVFVIRDFPEKKPQDKTSRGKVVQKATHSMDSRQR